jgi:predicted N-acetyltransferase YhbS
VHAVAVRPDLQGRALGSALVRRLLTEVRARNGAHIPVVLATQDEANLGFYARFNFRLTHQCTIGRGVRRPGFVSWFMRHEPATSADMATGWTNS